METEKTLNEQEKDLLWEHIKMLSEKAKQTTEAAGLDRLTGAICTAVVTLQNLL